MMGRNSIIIEAKAKKSVEELYRAIFAIRDALQDAQQLAAEAAVMSDAFGGEIARVITAQINTFFIPGISKFIDDAETPGAMSPLITFLDSVPLAMTRGEPEPQQVTPAPVANPQLAEPASTAQPAAGSYAAKTQESRKRETIEDRVKRGYSKGLLTPKQAFDNLCKEGLEASQAKQLVKQWQSEDEALYESLAIKECYQIIRKGKKDEQIVATQPSKEAADAKAAALNSTITPTEKDFFGTEYIVRASKKPEGQKDVSQAKAIPAPRKLPETTSVLTPAEKADIESAAKIVATESSSELSRPEFDEYWSDVSGFDPSKSNAAWRYFKACLASLAPVAKSTASHGLGSGPQFAGPKPGWMTESKRNREMTAGETTAADPVDAEDVSALTDDQLRSAFLRLANSDDAWFSGRDAASRKYKDELDRRGAKLYPESRKAKKESLSLKDIPIDDYTIDEAYDELMQGGEVEDDLAPDYIAQNMFGADEGSERYNQVVDKIRGRRKEAAVVGGDLGSADVGKLRQQVAAMIEKGYEPEEALDYVSATEEVDYDALRDACDL